jgi:hypothetical protein
MALTILQGLKKIKHLDRKIKKTQERIGKWGSYIDPMDLPVQYEVNPLIQSVNDMLEERARIRHALHVTNAVHVVDYKGQPKTVDDLLIRLTVTIPMKIATLKQLRRKEKPYHLGKDSQDHKVVLQYDPAQRDRDIDALENELDEINGILDEINISVDVFKYAQ